MHDVFLEQLEGALSSKQKKVINFLVGKVMAVSKTVDPKQVRALLLEKLCILTYEEESINE